MLFVMFFFFNDTATTEIYTLSLHDALPISSARSGRDSRAIALEWPEVRQRPMGGGNGLSALEMGVCRHQRVFKRGRVVEHHLLERTRCGVELCACVH